ncbi:hypothetical protein ABVN80_00500 [Acinetobacter baumannii]
MGKSIVLRIFITVLQYPTLDACSISKIKAKTRLLSNHYNLSRAMVWFHVTFFSYAVGDVDSYDEVSVAVVVRQPGAHHFNTTRIIEFNA